MKGGQQLFICGFGSLFAPALLLFVWRGPGVGRFFLFGPPACSSRSRSSYASTSRLVRKIDSKRYHLHDDRIVDRTA